MDYAFRDLRILRFWIRFAKEICRWFANPK